MIDEKIKKSIADTLGIRGVAATKQEIRDDDGEVIGELPVKVIWIAELWRNERKPFAISVVNTGTEHRLLYTRYIDSGQGETFSRQYETFEPILLKQWDDPVAKVLQNITLISLDESVILSDGHYFFDMYVSSVGRLTAEFRFQKRGNQTEPIIENLWYALRTVTKTIHDSMIDETQRSIILMNLYGRDDIFS